MKIDSFRSFLVFYKRGDELKKGNFMSERRHSSLIPLSHDHHQGLVLALRLTKRRSLAPESKWPRDLAGQAEATLAFYREQLLPHFHVEEEVLFPCLSPFLKPQETLVSDLIEEHKKMGGLIAELRSALHPGTRLDEILSRFGILLAHHIRDEERKLFPLFEERVPEAEARQIGEEISRALGREAPELN
ncbi:MAG TPA: hemerythrin domain-containing protein [bacterium]|nr:hemerythrin domain-containing protein [bacterium]